MRLAIIPGDGIGKEVTAAALTVLGAVGDVFGRTFDLEQLPWSADYYLESGVTMPAGGYDLLRQFDAIFIGALGGATARPAPSSAAYAHRDAKFVMNVHGRWESPADDEAGIGWARDFFRASAPFASGGVYVNFLTADEGDRLRSAYGANYDRLAQVKRRYDPDNLFRVNQNIEPAASGAPVAASVR